MQLQSVSQLTHDFARPGLRFEKGPGGLIVAVVETSSCKARVSLLGGQLLDYAPAHSENLIWLSRTAKFGEGKAIRGGVPVCWPWFGPHPDDPKLPQHGFVRNRFWRVEASGSDDQGEPWLTLALEDDHETLTLWPHRFRLELEIRFGRRLGMELRTHNRDREPFTITEALHTYFEVGDINSVQVGGLSGFSYKDKVLGFAEGVQTGPVKLSAETDRVFEGHDGICEIDDPSLRRAVRIRRFGSRSVVVWNPWQEKAAGMADFDDDGWRNMLCVEAANALADVVTVEPDGEHSLVMQVETLPLPE
ncbi:MAG: D-hexose-6-phosphate mutarotase [Chromatiales bacterium]|nr:D-hexose-6-phosphate mutarotase [Chromatiales bacterium]